MMQPSNLNSSRYGIILFSFVLILGLAVLAMPSNSFARGKARAQDNGQAAPAHPNMSKYAAQMPEGEGKNLAVEYCQDCHELSNIVHMHQSADDWKDTVDTMIDHGARIPPEKVDTLVKYLGENFGRKAPPSAAVADSAAPATAAAPAPAPVAPASTTAQIAKPSVDLPEGDGKAIATEYCQDCHRLTNLTKSHMNLADWQDTIATMVDRGARIPPEKVDALAQYLFKNFGPKTAVPADGAPAVAPAPAN